MEIEDLVVDERSADLGAAVGGSRVVTSNGWRADQNRARVLTSGRDAFAHDRQWLPTAAWTRHDSQAGVPHRVQRRPAGRAGWR